MPEQWRFYRFDYTLYLELRPALRSAATAQALATIAETAETEALALAAQDGEITLQEARQGWLTAMCCPGEPLMLDRSFAHFVGLLGRRKGAEAAAETLAELAAGGKNLEAWLLPSYGLAGFLTPEETRELAASYAPLAKSGRLPVRKRRRTRRGGLLGWVRGFFRRLVDDGLQMEEILALLGELLDEAAANGEGIAVISG